MVSAEALSRMTTEQRRRISLLGVQARELKRQADGSAEFRMIPEGLQIANITLDFRCGDARMHHILLFHAGYHNRYTWMLNNKEQDGLIGWTPAMRRMERNLRPILSHYTL